MGILERVAHDNAEEIEEEHRKLAAKVDETERVKVRRQAIVDCHMQRFGLTIGEAVEPVDVAKPASYYIVGDIIVVVRAFGYMSAADLQTVVESDVLWQHSVAVVGIDIVGEPHEVGRSTLRLYGYERIRSAIIGRPDLDYDSHKVLPLIG